MQLSYEVDFSGWERLNHAYEYRLNNLLPAYAEVGDLLVEEVRENIETSGGAEHWRPLLPGTLTAERLKYGDRPNLKTGELLRSISKVVTNDYVDVGSPLEKSKTLFFGLNRSPFKWRPGVMDRVAKAFTRHLFGGLS